MFRVIRHVLTGAALAATTTGAIALTAEPAFAIGPATVTKSGTVLTVTATSNSGAGCAGGVTRQSDPLDRRCGIEGEGDPLRIPIKKPAHGELTVDHQAYNAVHGALRCLIWRAFLSRGRVKRCPWPSPWAPLRSPDATLGW